jgi:MoaA/NifB/PqqE/SkfB family radical SAM enzyme
MRGNYLYETILRYHTLQTGNISSLPIVILMPHSSCNCRCIMCDIWKDNKNLRQLTESDITGLLESLRKLHVRQVVMSGGEALLSPNFFILCRILQKEKIKITLLSTGLLLKKYATGLLEYVDNIIVSVDGDERTHDLIRNIPGAFGLLREGISYLHQIDPSYPIRGRSVIHRLNFKKWPAIIQTALELGLSQISFLPADVSSHAFNRSQPWDQSRQEEILLKQEELSHLQDIISEIGAEFQILFQNGFISEPLAKLQKIHTYYSAFYGLCDFPYKKCNAPWVSTVIEADGTVRPCFFHSPLGNIHEKSLSQILNSKEAVSFRKNLDINSDSTCIKCVCYLNLPPGTVPL